MVSPILRWLGGLAGLGSAILWWFLGSVLSAPTRKGELLHLGRARYELIVFLLVPALVLGVLGLFWIPGPPDRTDSIRGASGTRLLLLVVFVAAFLVGFVR